MHRLTAQEVDQWRQWAKAQAIAADISLSEVDWFLQAVTNLTPLDLRLALPPTIASSHNLAELLTLWTQRITEKIPVQYLVGQAPWRNFELTVTPAVLIPRPETEYLIDLVQSNVNTAQACSTGDWVDLGTGSGAIALGLAEILPQATIHAVDQSPAALQIAQQNAARYSLNAHIQFYQGSWWEPLQHLRGQVSGMVSNPPYIPSALLPDLQPEVYRHEPHSALDGGTDGLEDIRILVNEAPDYLVTGGMWLIEMMRGQGQDIARLLAQNGDYTNIQVINDFAGGDRYVLAYRR